MSICRASRLIRHDALKEWLPSLIRKNPIVKSGKIMYFKYNLNP
jgi:hypothetical protein